MQQKETLCKSLHTIRVSCDKPSKKNCELENGDVVVEDGCDDGVDENDMIGFMLMVMRRGRERGRGL